MTCSCHFWLSECVFLFHELHQHGLHVPAIFDYKEVRIYISWAIQSWLTCSCHFDSQWVRNHISWATPSRLTCSCHFRLSACAYLYFISSTIVADTFLPLSTLSGCVFPFHELHHHGLQFLPFRLSGSAYLYIMSHTIMADTFLFTLSGCVIAFRGLHHRGWHVPVIFDYQQVRTYISWATQICWLVPATFHTQWVRIPELHDHS